MADFLAEFNNNFTCNINIRAVCAYCENIGRTADCLVCGSAVSVHEREQSNACFEVSISNFAGVPTTILIERGLSSQEVCLYIIVAERNAGRIEVTLIDHFLKSIN